MNNAVASPDVQAIIAGLAQWTLPGECSTCGKDGSVPNAACEAHGQWEPLDYEDELRAVAPFILAAREILRQQATARSLPPGTVSERFDDEKSN